jgi:ATP-dependent Clp protease ATP-binding subunit ClpC
VAERTCTRCGINPAVTPVRRIAPGRGPVVEHLCGQCLAETASRSGPGRNGLFDEFLRQFLAGQVPEGVGEPGGRGQHPHGGPVNQIDITRLFSTATKTLIQRAATNAADTGRTDLEPEDLLLAAIEDHTVEELLHVADVDPDDVARWIVEHLETGDRTGRAPALSPESKRVLLVAYEESRRAGASYIGPEHILIALAEVDDTMAREALAHASLDGERLRRAHGHVEGHRAAQAPSATPTIDQYSRDLTELARDGKLDPVVGRVDEIDQTIEVLSRRTKNNPVLVGDAGVGKTAVVEGIAQRIVNGEAPATIADRRVVSLELGGLLAGTRYRGEFEERLERIMAEIRAHADDLLLFIDELHTIVGAGGGEGSLDAANMLKPALARGELHVIGATTLDEYRRHIEADAALERRFQPVLVPEPSPDEAVEILFGLKDRYEAFHCVRITDEAIDAAVELADRYIADRFLPDKAIDLLDQAGARVRLRQKTPSGDGRARRDRIAELEREKDQAVAAEDYERAAELKGELEQVRAGGGADGDLRRAPEVVVQDIAEVVARRTGIPVAQLTTQERARLAHLEDHLHRRVIDQTDAVSAVAQAIRRSRAGLSDPDRPIGSFLFLGPTGVGKTELARTLAEAMFGDEDLMVRFDMSEFQERHTVSRLIGSPPGYVGYEEAGQLTERVRRRPYSVLLLDEIEKAHPDVFNVLLQLLDDGRVTDAHGRTVDFTNTVVIMTSNLGAERIHGVSSRVGFRPRQEQEDQVDFAALRSELMDELRRNFRPEFLNRIDEIVVFRPLAREQLHEITRLLLDEIVRRLRARDIGVELSEDAVHHLAQEGFDPEFGARPLRRAIQRELENELSTLVLRETVVGGDRVLVDVRDGSLAFEVDRGGFEGGPLADWQDPGEAPRPQTAGPAAPRD